MTHETSLQETARYDGDGGQAHMPAWYERLYQIAESVADGIVISDASCHVQHANPAAERIFGQSREALLGRACNDPAWRVALEDGTPVEPSQLSCRHALDTGDTAQPVERIVTRPDGSRVSVLVSASPIKDDEGRIIGVLTAYTDVTAIKQAESIRRENDAYNSSLLRLYALLGQANSYTAIVQALLTEMPRMLGYKGAGLLLLDEDRGSFRMLDSQGSTGSAAEGIKELGNEFRAGPPDEEFLVLPIKGDRFLEDLAETTDIDVMEDARLDPRGNQEIVEAIQQRTIVNVPLMLAGKKLGMLNTGTFGDEEGVRPPTPVQLDYLRALSNHVAVAIDRVRFLGERRAAEEALRESEERYRRFVETSDEGVMAQDAGMRITYASERMAELLCCRPKDMLGRPTREFVFEEDLPVLDEEMESRRRGGAGNYQLRFRRADGSPIWLSLSASPILDESGAFQGSFVMATDISGRKQAELEREELLGQLTEMLDGVVDALSATTSERDPYTAAHQSRVARLALAIADRMELDAEVIDGLRIASMLHDIGKIAVPAEILSKPTKLTEMEMGVVRVHSSVGYRLLKGVRFTRPVARIVLQHHERLDGSGYPDGLAGDEILIEARILAVADVVEAMASHRPYRPARGIEAALEEIRYGAGRLYDPDVVEVCVDIFSENPAFIP